MSSSSPIEGRRWTIWRYVVDGAVGEWTVGEPPRPKDVLVPGATVETVEVMPVEEHEAAMKVGAGGGCAEDCERCGRGNVIWSAMSPLWNAVIRGGSIDGEPKYGDMVCPTCFMQLAEEQGIASHFRVTADEVNVELEMVTPSGRAWDEESALWVTPDATPTQPNPIGDRERLEELLKAVEPFTVDGGVSCGREESDALDEAYQRIRDEQKAGS